jgi:hypothetical protein
MVFGSGSRLQTLECTAFFEYELLESLCLPASLRVLPDTLLEIPFLKLLTFEPESTLEEIRKRT